MNDRTLSATIAITVGIVAAIVSGVLTWLIWAAFDVAMASLAAPRILVLGWRALCWIVPFLAGLWAGMLVWDELE